jgi:hypothetical protein
MPDEIDLLRTFRAQTPGPDDAAWERARAAVALAEGPAAPEPRSRRLRPGGTWRFRRHRVTRGRVILAAAVVIVVGVAAGVLTTVLQGPPSLNAPVVTAWQPARPLPAGSGGITAPAGTWHLMGYLVAKDWQENTSGPGPGWLTCPVPASVGQIMTLACITAATCRGLASAAGRTMTQGFGTLFSAMRVLRHFRRREALRRGVVPEGHGHPERGLPDNLPLRGDRRAQQLRSRGGAPTSTTACC